MAQELCPWKTPGEELHLASNILPAWGSAQSLRALTCTSYISSPRDGGFGLLLPPVSYPKGLNPKMAEP